MWDIYLGYLFGISIWDIYGMLEIAWLPGPINLWLLCWTFTHIRHICWLQSLLTAPRLTNQNFHVGPRWYPESWSFLPFVSQSPFWNSNPLVIQVYPTIPHRYPKYIPINNQWPHWVAFSACIAAERRALGKTRSECQWKKKMLLWISIPYCHMVLLQLWLLIMIVLIIMVL